MRMSTIDREADAIRTRHRPRVPALDTAVASTYTDTELAAHVAAADPHTGYQKESEKGAVGGYPSLDGSGTVPDAQIPSAIARDAEVTSAVATGVSTAEAYADTADAAHVAASDPHTQYQKESEKDATGGYPSYETGTWTPALKFGGATTGITYTIQTATYTKVGRVVHFMLRILLSSKGSATGAATITGLPFASAGSSANWMFYAQGDNVTAEFQAFLDSATQTLALYSQGTSPAALDNTNLANNTQIRASGSYHT